MHDSGNYVSADESFAGLVVKARAGSHEALGELLQRCRRYLWLVGERELSARVQGKESPSDVVQLTCMDAQKNFEHFVGQTQHDLLAWLRTILLHHVTHVHRRYEQTDKRNVDCEAVHISPDEETWQLHAVHKVASPSASAMRRERQAQLWEALNTMPETYQQVIILHHRDQLDFDEIGQRMSRSTSAVRKLWTRALSKLQDLLEIADDSQ